MNLDKEGVAERIRRFAEGKKLKMKDIAALLDMTPGALNASYLTGRSVPGPELLIKFHNMGCNIVWLLTGEGQPEWMDPEPMQSLHRDDEAINSTQNFTRIMEKIQAENLAFRKALTPEMVEFILKNMKV